MSKHPRSPDLQNLQDPRGRPHRSPELVSSQDHNWNGLGDGAAAELPLSESARPAKTARLLDNSSRRYDHVFQDGRDDPGVPAGSPSLAGTSRWDDNSPRSGPGVAAAPTPGEAGSIIMQGHRWQMSEQNFPSNLPQADKPIYRTRGTTACKTCRSRKTKCDSRRPKCTYCERVGCECVYAEDEIYPHSCHVFGPQILSAVQNLTDLVQTRLSQPAVLPGPRQTQARENARPDAAPLSQPSSKSDIIHDHTSCSNVSAQGGVEFHDDASSIQRSVTNLDRGGFTPQGLDEILNWNVHGLAQEPGTSFPGLLRNTDGYSTNKSVRPPTVELVTMMRLRSRYIAGIHCKNPFLDLQQLDKEITNIVELGLDWTVETCLVALVCSIGAVSEPLAQRWSDQSPADIPLAMEFWNVAIRRLGLAIGSHTLEAAQCLCLAGIWYMNMLQPLQAWNYFNLAANSRYLMMLRDQSTSNLDFQKALTLEQTLYFTIYKSECELRAELALPASVLSNMDLLYNFPVPPRIDIGSGVLTNGIFDTERAWYYYLAEIASRHLLNRVLQAQSSYNPLASRSSTYRRMLMDLDMFETQLEEWYTSLPLPIKFELPYGEFLPILNDDLQHIVRSRYLTIREILYRPFVRLCIENSMEDFDAASLSKVALVASQGLTYAVYRMQVAVVSRHQGLWFTLRNLAAMSLILTAANQAHTRPDRFAARRIVMPTGWRDRIDDMLFKIDPYLKEPVGGVSEAFQSLAARLSN
ncbi:hypothetical protein BX600DRAFT_466683 [Xylariales sp. PMI_506]|nr:hypothetical protein BX600DRAFT_466683 [Xylariales sp. PMI_506]